MICSPTRLIASSRIVKLIFADPTLIVVTTQTVSTPKRSIEFRGKVIGASLCGSDRIVVLSADGVLHLYNLELEELISRTVGLPNEWAGCEHTFVTSNPVGSTVAFGLSDNTSKLYAVSNSDFVYLGTVDIHKDARHCVITNGLPGAPGLLLAFSSTLVKVVEISPMMPTVSTVRISNEPILYIHPLSQDGDCLLITRNRVRLFAIRNILIGKFELPMAKLPGPLLAASSTLLKSGIVHNTVICGSKLYELVLGDGKIEAELVCRLPDFMRPTDIELYFCLSGAGLWFVQWFGRGTRGQFMINEDKECRQLDPEYELDFDAKDFLIDTASNSIVGFGRQPNLDFISKCLALNDLIKPIDAPLISGLVYEPISKLLFVVYPTETHILHLAISESGIKLSEVHIFQGRCLVASSHAGVCACLFDTKRIYLRGSDFMLMNAVELPLPVTSAVVLAAKILFCTADNKLYSIPVSRPSVTPDLLFESSACINSIYCIDNLEILYCTNFELMRFNMHSKTGHQVMEANEYLQVSDLVYFQGKYYTAYRDGYISISETITTRDKIDSEKLIKLDACPISFAIENESKLLARGAGLWLVKDFDAIPIVRLDGSRHESFAQFIVAGACFIPHFDLTLVVAYGNQVRIVSTEELQLLTSKPQVESVPVSKVILAIEKGVRFRAWLLATVNGLEFYDTKRRTQIKVDTDLSSSERITALCLWEIEREGTMYTHLAIGISRPKDKGSEYILRSCTIKRERNAMSVKKRLKLPMEKMITSIKSFDGKLLVSMANHLVPVSYSKECGLSADSRIYSVEGTIQDASVTDAECTLSTSRGLIQFDLRDHKLLTDANHMVNRMRNCTCHISCMINNKSIILVAQKDCFLQVMELKLGIWRVVQRIDANERIIRMHHITSESIDIQETIVIALTNIGSFVQLKIGESGVKTGPYLF